MAKIQNVSASLAGHALDAALADYARRQAQPKDTGPATLAAFARLVKPDYEESRLTNLFCEELEAVERGDVRKLMMFTPPREGKSLHSSELFPAWFLGRNPSLQIVLSSYNDDLAERNSRMVRDLIMENEHYPYTAECQVRSDVKGVSLWQTTKGGIVRAAGVSGGGTGFGAHLLVIDDYCKNSEEAMSPPLRDRAWNWYTTVARLRLMRGGRQLIVATRWHEDDLAGRILNSAGASDWRVVSVPMESEGEGDPLGRPLGEFLNCQIPEEDVPRITKGEISETDYAALYQQTPSALEGNMFKRDDWVYYDLDEMLNTPGFMPMFTTVDTAFKTQASNDWSVAATWGTYRGRAYLIDLWRAKVAFPQLILELHKIYKRWQVPLIIEDRASGQSAIQVMGSAIEQGGNQEGQAEDLARALSFGQDRIPIVAFKIPRYSTDISLAQAVTPFVQAHAVCLPKGEPWIEAFVDEHAKFPAGSHNDQVRTTAMALPKIFAAVQQTQTAGAKPRWTTYRIGTTMDAGGSLDEVLSKELFGR